VDIRAILETIAQTAVLMEPGLRTLHDPSYRAPAVAMNSLAPVNDGDISSLLILVLMGTSNNRHLKINSPFCQVALQF
jgi:hypothetical protein